jgi:hypothetical protein
MLETGEKLFSKACTRISGMCCKVLKCMHKEYYLANWESAKLKGRKMFIPTYLFQTK